MKTYPSIPKKIREDLYCYAFKKLDGSNIRAEWSKKQGFYKFGSRHQLIDEKHEFLGESIKLIKDKYEKELSLIFKNQKYEQALCFFEFYVPSSFARQHNKTEKHDVILIDVNSYKKGILNTDKFIDLFGKLDIPQVLFEGYLTEEFIEQIKKGSLEEFGEGVVVKAAPDTNQAMPIMFKIKTEAWLLKLRDYCKGDNDLFEKLA